MMELFSQLQSFSREHQDRASLNSEQTGGGSEGSRLAAGNSLPYTSTSLRSCFCSALAFQTSPRCSAWTAPSQTHSGCSSLPARFQYEKQIRYNSQSKKLCPLHPSESPSTKQREEPDKPCAHHSASHGQKKQEFLVQFEHGISFSSYQMSDIGLK